VGCDIAKRVDHTVVVALRTDVTPWRLLYFDRYNKRPYPEVERDIKHVGDAFANSEVIIDSTGVGDVTMDHLDIEGWRVDGFKFTSKSKTELIENLVWCLENKRIAMPYIPELQDELYDYEWDDKDIPNTDAVMALALACWKANDRGVEAVMV